MVSKILIANRGEIAVRVVRACGQLGLSSVAVYSEADADCLHAKMADEKICVGPPPSSKSYLNIDSIIKAAKESGADAVHPGYGYLAENVVFAERCEREGIVFIGPTPRNIRLAGDKIGAKRAMQQASVPTVPSSEGEVSEVEQAAGIGREIGFPVMIKASGGGGGRGIRICSSEEVLRDNFQLAKAESLASFGNAAVYIEKLVERPRHVEVQILGDRNGNIVHLGERECTIQRRYQKLIEESPSPGIDDDLRDRICQAAISAAKAIEYFNAGTVEFLVDEEGDFYFIEINSRIQVEHPVTEQVTGIDLVKEQIRLSRGEAIGYASEDLEKRGAAIECRINAEDPDNGFMPCPGKVERLRIPDRSGVRIDTHLYQGYELPVFYDSLVAKLIAHGPDRKGAIEIMKEALDELEISPIKTTAPLHRRIMDEGDFIQGRFDTGYIRRFVEEDEEDNE